MAPTISTRFLIISDTHNFDPWNQNMFDPEDSDSDEVAFQPPVPKADVLLHCGDLTMYGGLEEYEGVMHMLGQVDAELKLIIAGNHDLSLDETWWKKNSRETEDESAKNHQKAVEAMKGETARKAGVTYLDEGMHFFTLKNGARFSLYASPYQPEFCNWAFPYHRNEDRFNPHQDRAEGAVSIATNPVPDFPAVDIMMTHGPPKGILDEVDQGRKALPVGCDHLLRAASRARPRLYCFGHIHEGHGANLITWDDEKRRRGADAIHSESSETNAYPKANDGAIEFGRQTLMVNASIMTVRYRPLNKPWLVDLDIPVAEEVSESPPPAAQMP